MPITESNSPWIKASVRTPTKEDDYYIKYTTGKKETLYASGTGHHKRWSALVDEWLDEEKLSRMVAELEAARELIKLQNDTIENQHRLMINAEQRGMDKVRVELEAKDKRIAELEGLVGTSDTERILCAAVHHNDGEVYQHQPKNIETGIVFGGRRHHNCIILAATAFPDRNKNNEVQGFITSHDRFVDRKEAMQIAKVAGQVPTKQSFEELYSEDLY